MGGLGMALGLLRFVQNGANVNPLISALLGNDEVYTPVTVVANIRACQNTMPRAGTIQSITIYHNGGTGNVLMGVYSDNTDTPHLLLRGTASTAISRSEGWQTINLTAPLAVMGGQKIWLAPMFETNPGVRYSAGTPGRAQGISTWSNSGGILPDIYGEVTFSDYRYSLYCTYTYGGA